MFQLIRRANPGNSPNINLKFLCVCIIALLSTRSFAETYASANLSDNSKTLTITSSQGAQYIFRTEPDQENFGDIKISSNKQVVGWIIYAYCCSAFSPHEAALVIFKDGKIVQKFDKETPLLDWRFEQHDKAVAYVVQPLHFVIGTNYMLRSISSGKVLQEFWCDVSHSGERHTISKNVPYWVWPLRYDCPYTDTNIEE